ncbi:MAG: hypothetical protein M0C28_03620 [Candidatus Moduliflexus flocculans]|nr:hypothetical protein [Candidatus Moduliflexus flocculans]
MKPTARPAALALTLAHLRSRPGRIGPRRDRSFLIRRSSRSRRAGRARRRPRRLPRRRAPRRPHSQARAGPAHQRHPRLRRPARLALPLHHPRDRRPPDDLRRREPARRARARHGHRADHGLDRRSRHLQRHLHRRQRPRHGRAPLQDRLRPDASPSPRTWAGTAGTSGRTASATRSCAPPPTPWSRAAWRTTATCTSTSTTAGRSGPSPTTPAAAASPATPSGLINANGYFPDMKAMTDYIHAKGLKAGIYTSPGPRTCAGFTAAWQHEEPDVRRFVEWGFDFLKYDWCSYGDTADEKNLDDLQRPYRLISGILAAQPRDIVLNLCQYGMGKVWEWGARGRRPQLAHRRRPRPRRRRQPLPRRLRRLFRERAPPLRRPRRLERPRLSAHRHPQLRIRHRQGGRQRSLAALAQRAVHPRLALVARRGPAHLQRRHHPPRRLHPGPPHQRRDHRGRPGPARQARQARREERRPRGLGPRAGGRLEGGRALQPGRPPGDGHGVMGRSRHLGPAAASATSGARRTSASATARSRPTSPATASS